MDELVELFVSEYRILRGQEIENNEDIEERGGEIVPLQREYIANHFREALNEKQSIQLDQFRSHSTSELYSSAKFISTSEKLSGRSFSMAAAAGAAGAAASASAGTGSVKEDSLVSVRSHTQYLSRFAHTFLVAIDSSPSSDAAYRCFLELRRKYDNVVLFHSYRVAPTPLSSTLPGGHRAVNGHDELQHLREHYEERLRLAVSSTHYHMSFMERSEGETVSSALADVAKLCRDPFAPIASSEHARALFGGHLPDFLIIGYSGRYNELENCKTFMGASTSLAFRNVPIPIIIAKENPSSPTVFTAVSSNVPARKFLYCADGKEKSRQGLDILLTLLQPHDSLTVVHFVDKILDEADQQAAELIKAYFEEELRRAGPVTSEFTQQIRHTGTTLTQSIISFANDVVQPHFLVICPRAKLQTASMSEQIIMHSNCSVILCKM